MTGLDVSASRIVPACDLSSGVGKTFTDSHRNGFLMVDIVVRIHSLEGDHYPARSLNGLVLGAAAF